MPDIPISSSVGWPPERYYATGRCLWERMKVKEHRVHSVGTCSEGLWDRWRPSWPRPASGRCSLSGQTLTSSRYITLAHLKCTCMCKALEVLQNYWKVCSKWLKTYITKHWQKLKNELMIDWHSLTTHSSCILSLSTAGETLKTFSWLHHSKYINIVSVYHFVLITTKHQPDFLTLEFVLHNFTFLRVYYL